MTVPGVTVVPLFAPTREEQLQAEVNELNAKLEQTRAELATYPHHPTGEQDLAVLGGGMIAEADGWLWLIIQNSQGGTKVHRLTPASPEAVAQAAVLRQIAAAHQRAQSFSEAQRQRNAS